MEEEFEKVGGMLEKAQKNLQTASGQIEEVLGTRTRAIQRKLKDVDTLSDREARAILPEIGILTEEDEKAEIDEEDDYEAERKRMIERLIEKNRINGILEAFEASYDKRQTMHSKIPSALEEYLPSGEETIPEGMEVYDLIKAMQRVMQRRALLHPLESKIARVEISIDERTEQIRSYFLRHKGKTVDFEDLFDEGDRYFAIVTFLSILVLVKNSELLITQSGNFEKIYLKGTSYGQE